MIQQEESELDRFLARVEKETATVGPRGALDRFLERAAPTTLERAHGFAAGVASGALEGAVAGTLKGAGILSGIDALKSGGEAVSRFGESLHPDNPLARDTITTKAGEALGQGLGFMVPGGAAGKALKLGGKGMAGIVATQGALANGAGGYYDALASGATEGAAMESFLLNAAVGATEAAPLAQILVRIKRAAKPTFNQAMRYALVEGAEEATQESVQQVLGNVIAQNLYDEERETLAGMVEGGALGAFAGVVLSALGSGGAHLMPDAPAPGVSSAVGDLGGEGQASPQGPPTAAEYRALELYRTGPGGEKAKFVEPQTDVQRRAVEELGAVGIQAKFTDEGPKGMRSDGVMIFNSQLTDAELSQSIILHEVSHEVRARLAGELTGELREDLGPWQDLFEAVERLDPAGLAATTEALIDREYEDTSDPDELLANYLEDRGGFFFSEELEAVLDEPSLGRRIINAVVGMLQRIGLPVSTKLEKLAAEQGFSKDAAVEIRNAIDQMTAVLSQGQEAAESGAVVEAEVSAPIETEFDIVKRVAAEGKSAKTKRRKDNKARKRQALGGEFGLRAFVAASGGLERTAETERYVRREGERSEFGPITRSKKGGLKIDDLAEAATEAGIFPVRPTEAEFMDALDVDFNPRNAEMEAAPFARSKPDPKDEMREDLKKKRAEFQEAVKRVEEKGEEPTVERVTREREKKQAGQSGRGPDQDGEEAFSREASPAQPAREFKLTNEGKSSDGSGDHRKLSVSIEGGVVGELWWHERGRREVFIDYIEVGGEFDERGQRRKGHGRALIEELRRIRPGAKIDPGPLVDDGPRFAPAVGLSEMFARSKFFSPLEKKLETRTEKKLTVGQVKKLAKNDEEWEWSGLAALFEGRGSVPRAEILEYLEATNVRVGEEVLGEPEVPVEPLSELPEGYDVIVDQMQPKDSRFGITPPGQIHARVWAGRHPTAEAAKAAALERLNEKRAWDARKSTQHDSYQLPGGENYREVLVTLPVGSGAQTILDKYDLIDDTASEATLREAGATDAEVEQWRGGTPKADFTSSHYDTPNVLFHTRFNERGDTLFVEEFQSDWHQEGRKKGYKGEFPKEVLSAAVKGGMTKEQATADIELLLKTPTSPANEAFGNPIDLAWQRLTDATISDRSIDLNYHFHDKSTPNAPFKKTWPTLALKRMIQWAAENGFKKLGWTTGRQQVERYEGGMRAVVDEIAWKSAPGYRPDSAGGGTADYREVTAKKSGSEVMRLSVNLADGLVEAGREEAIGKPIEDVVGKEIGKQILEREGGSVSGDQITIGGKGMEDFYDKILVNAANKLGKRFGARATTEEIRTGNAPDEVLAQHADVKPFQDANRAVVHTLPITPELAAKAAEGFGMFSRSKLTETREFKAWFKGSKVVTDGGEPLVVLHGSPRAGHTVFDLAKTGTASDEGWFGQGFYFTKSAYVAGDYAYGAWSDEETKSGAAIYPVYLSLKNPFHWRSDSAQEVKETEARARRAGFSTYAGTINPGESKVSPEEVRVKLLAAGYDGIIVNEGANTAEYIAFAPEQIKSATGNRGTFDPNDPDIRHARSPVTETREFRAWFKASKVVTDGGEPLVVYHGTHAGFTEFDPKKVGSNFEYDEAGFFFSGDPTDFPSGASSFASGEGGRVLPVYLSIQNPYTLEAYAKFVGPEVTLDDLQLYDGDPQSVVETFDQDRENIIAQAREGGHDGISFEYQTEDGGDTMYVAFSPTQIKSATGNRGTFDPNDPDIRHARSPLTETRADTWAGRRYRQFIDKMDPVKKLSPDTWEDEQLRKGHTKTELGRLEREFEEPLIKEARKQAKKKVELPKKFKDLQPWDAYLMARHAEERNERIESTPGGGRNGSGLTKGEAQKLLSLLPHYKKFGELHDALHKETRRLWVEYGLETQETVNNLESAYAHYTPLRTDMEKGGLGIGRGDDIRGTEFKAATGRSTLADSPLAFSIVQLQNAAIRGEKAKVGRRFLNWLRENPDPKIAIIQPDLTKKALVNGVIRRVYDPHKKHADNVFSVKENGEEVLIAFTEEYQPLADALTNASASYGGSVTEHVGNVTRTLAALSTRWNPVFPLFNGIRDATGAFLNNVEEGAAFAWKATNPVELGKAFRTLWKFYRKPDRVPQNDYERAMQRYFQSGAPIAFLALDNFREQNRRLSDAIKRPSRSIAFRKLKDLGKLIEGLNDSVENAARASAFIHAQKELGWSEKKAALWAKDLTTNFERKGELGGLINSWWAFSNAAIQGTDRVGRALKSPKVQKATASMIVGFAILDVINRAIGGDDEDGESYYEKIPAYIKRTNLIVMTGQDGKYVTIPTPFVYNFFASMGTSLGGVFSGNVTPGTAAVDTFMSSLDVFNPIGGAGGGDTPAEVFTPENMLPLFSPTVIEPFAQLAVNRNFMGGAIAPMKFPGQIRSDAASHWPDTSPAAVATAKGLNRLFGGSDVLSSGITDVSPETLLHLLKAGTGGLGTTLERTFRLAFGDEESQLRDKPLVRRLYKEPSEYRHTGQFRENLMELNTLHARYEELTGVKKSQFRKAHPELRLRARAKTTDRRRKKMEDRGLDTDKILSAFNRSFAQLL